MNVRLRIALMLVAMACSGPWFCARVSGQVLEPAPTAVHLVGHEDTALLQRVQQLIDDWDPRKLRNPYVGTRAEVDKQSNPKRSSYLKRADLAEFIADVEAAEALGKAFFWEMQAGSDFQRLADGRFVGTACASCHYRFGADARNRYTTRVPYVAWDQYKLDPDHPLEFGETPQTFPVKEKAIESIDDLRDLLLPRGRGVNPRRNGTDTLGEEDDDGPRTAFSLIVGSQGVEPRIFDGLNPEKTPPPGGGAWQSELSRNRSVATGFDRYKPEWAMFVEGQQEDGKRFRQITARNSPSTYNAVFSDRLFHDGRAESTFNGISIFGDFDHREVLHVRRPSGELKPVRVAISKAALASQAVGPIVNEVEMSYLARDFPHLAKKLLDSPVLGYQIVADDDSHLGRFKIDSLKNTDQPGLGLTYRQLIQRAFRSEWWNGLDPKGTSQQQVELRLANVGPATPYPRGELMKANFSLYWGLGILLYEASLVSNQSPFDAMMRGDGEPVQNLWEKKKGELGRVDLDRIRTDHPPPFGTDPPPLQTGTEFFQRGFRLFLNRGCVECHSGPLLSEVYSREDAQEPKLTIALTIEHTLLPNSRGDAIAFRLAQHRKNILNDVAAALRGAGLKDESKLQRLVRELDLLRESSRGSEQLLKLKIGARLKAAQLPETEAEELARILTTMEKTLAQHSGNRHFFSEDERVAMTELLTDPVLVERMPVPFRLKDTRRPLPISGRLARAHYAFYDLGFYNLGVAPPRYDRGNGTWNPPEYSTEEAFEKVEQIVAANEGLLQGVKDKLAKDYELSRPEAKEQLARDLQAGELTIEGQKMPLSEALSAEEVQAVRLDVSREQIQAASGVRGSAYRLKLEWRRPRPEDGSQARNGFREAMPPAVEQPDDPDRDARNAFPRDVSWYRDLPNWDRLFPANPQLDSVDVRRSDVHFFSRARMLVQNEQPWGHRKPFLHDNELAFWGTFKTPTLRNVELTPPYMHNGRLLTLKDVVDFYDRGGDLLASAEFNPDKHPAIRPLDMTEQDKISLVFFLMCLTDDRVRHERAPFDHPSLAIVNGYDDQLEENWFDLEHVGTGGLPSNKSRSRFPAAN